MEWKRKRKIRWRRKPECFHTFPVAGCPAKIVMTRRASRMFELDMFGFSAAAGDLSPSLVRKEWCSWGPRHGFYPCRYCLLAHAKEGTWATRRLMQTICTQRTNLSRSNHVIRAAKINRDPARYYCYQWLVQTTRLPSLRADMGQPVW